MAKIKINFDDSLYNIDESSLSSPLAELQSHFLNKMNGSGEVLHLGGTSYNIDSTKLSNTANKFITHLGTIAGDGKKVRVNNTEYSIDSTKVSKAVEDIRAILGGWHSEDAPKQIAGLYRTGAVALYNEQGADAIEDMLIIPWNELIENGDIIIENGVITNSLDIKTKPDNLPEEKNEYGFYYDTPYYLRGADVYFHADGSADAYINGEIVRSFEAGTIVYSTNSIDVSPFNIGLTVGSFINDGTAIMFSEGDLCSLSGDLVTGDLILPNDNSISYISNYAFQNRLSITGLFSTANIGEAAFTECSNLTNVVLAEGVTSVELFAFNECTNLINVVLPDNSLTTIGRHAFSNTAITNIEVPDSVINFGGFLRDRPMSECFWGCANLKSVVLPGSIKNIGQSTFDRCTSLSDVTICEGITLIEFYAFGNCISLENITIPASMKMIENEAFSGCVNLRSVYYAGTVEQWNDIRKIVNWNYSVPATEVICSNGVVTL